MPTITHSYYLMLRHVRQLMREPWSLAFALAQPVIWFILYAQLFQRVVRLPGFGYTSYITFLMPGLVVTSALLASGWAGMGVVFDLDRGVIDRLLISPSSRVAIIAGRLLYLGITIAIQSLILIVLGLLLGASYSREAAGLAVLVFASIVLATGFGALSITFALAVRKEQSVLGAINFLLLPLAYVAPVFMARSVMPGWMQAICVVNPIYWAVEAARAALDAQRDWVSVLYRLAVMAVFATAACAVAVFSFRSYQRSV